MKKWIKITGIIVLAVVLCVVWYCMPVRFMKNAVDEKIVRVEVFNKNTGKRFELNAPTDSGAIEKITDNIRGRTMKRRGIALGRMGTMYNIRFVDKNGRTIDTLIINGSSTIRKGAFFYEDETDGLCVDYLNFLEKQYDK